MTSDKVVLPTASRVAAPVPLATPGSAFTGFLIAAAVLALGVVGIRDALVDLGAITGSHWISGAFEYVDGLAYQGWMLPAGIAAVVLGLWFVILGFKPRRKTANALVGVVDTWIDPADVAAIASVRVESLTNVRSASSHATRRKLEVKASVTPDGAATAESEIRAVLGNLAQTLSPSPRIKIRIQTGERS
ncbi:DUF6286 domain-containing protein [Rhodococcus erythropolis]|uniref:DUF6286 domain-containing protein n=1 Tax=Rhodococcus erythropolis TaxID=1833 RepID=UPI001E4A4BEC|nr:MULTISPECIES: DUF6286 domain-containing protein [Rhodococcus erythropolis group]MCD2107735.1 DUF6286 domain-containing protein [Rhodococcus qingshengii]MCZ4524816.1 DUF6286 domain-containing protein [Rhodococcus erythropolis]